MQEVNVCTTGASESELSYLNAAPVANWGQVDTWHAGLAALMGSKWERARRRERDQIWLMAVLLGFGI